MGRPNKAILTKEKVVDAAIAIIGDGGLEAFSMPRDSMFGEYEQACRFLADAGVPASLHVTIGLTAFTIGAAFLGENAAHYTTSTQCSGRSPAER